MTAGPARAAPLSQGLSVYLDLLRFGAAAIVFLHHASFHRFSGGLPGLWHLGRLGDDAVMLFFVLSGFVIAHVVAERHAGLPEYVAARLARLWSVCVPALVLTVVVDLVGMRLAPALYDFAWYGYDHPFVRLGASLLFLNELWFLSIQPFSNTPYWSVGYEFWYYLLFGAAMFLRGRRRLLAVLLVAAIAGPTILLLWPVWLLGVWAYRTPWAGRLSAPAAWGWCAATALAYVAYRQLDGPAALDALSARWWGASVVQSLGWSRHFLASYVVGLLCALHLLGARRVLASVHQVGPVLARPIRAVAGLTFALYLFHNPLLQFFSALATWWGAGALHKPLVLLGPLLVVALLGPWAEAQKRPLKQRLLRSWARLGGSRTGERPGA